MNLFIYLACLFPFWSTPPAAPPWDEEIMYNVVIFLHDECIISQYYTIPLVELHKDFSSIAQFIGVFPNPSMTDLRLQTFKSKYDIPFELKSDPNLTLVTTYSATITPEVFVVERSTDQIVYSGRIDNAYARVGRKRTVVTTFELKTVLQQIKLDQPIVIINAPAIGCLITK